MQARVGRRWVAAGFEAEAPSGIDAQHPRGTTDALRRLTGESRAMQSLRQRIAAVAASRATVLLVGETGTGKGLVARVVHDLSAEPRLPFVHVDCAALAPSVIESELFGHERGAYTGAVERRAGRFERAGRGTIFLDEVAEIEPNLQAKLLRVLQDRVFERVGGAEPLPADARVIAATNRDLPREIAAGRFRADLYYRLQVFELRIPPLRDRLSDLPLLLRAAVDRLDSIPGSRAQGFPTVTEAFWARLRDHTWAGNVRELSNLAERLRISNPAGPWDVAALDDALQPVVEGPAGALMSSRSDFAADERTDLARALADHRWNVSATARTLGLSRGALRGRMARLGLA